MIGALTNGLAMSFAPPVPDNSLLITGGIVLIFLALIGAGAMSVFFILSRRRRQEPHARLPAVYPSTYPGRHNAFFWAIAGEVVILLCLVVIGGLFLVIGPTDGGLLPAAQPSATATQRPAWAASARVISLSLAAGFEKVEYGFAIRYPADWTVVDTGGPESVVWFYPAGEDTGRTALAVTWLPMADLQPQYRTATELIKLKQPGGLRQVNSAESVTIAGESGARAFFKSEDAATRWCLVALTHEDRGYVLGAKASAATWDVDWPTLETMIRTFRPLAPGQVAGASLPPSPAPPTFTPSSEPTATPAIETPTPTATATELPTATPTNVPPTATITLTPPKIPKATRPPTDTPPPAFKYPAPRLLSPKDGEAEKRPGDSFVLEWEPVAPQLALDEYYRVYFESHGMSIDGPIVWGDYLTVKEPRLTGESGQGDPNFVEASLAGQHMVYVFWWVTVMRETGQEGGKRAGPDISPPSPRWSIKVFSR
jgi:hypothetical protein